jgi:hypothetical protein
MEGSMSLEERILASEGLELSERLGALASLAPEACGAIERDSLSDGLAETLRAQLLSVIETDVGSGVERLPVGEILGLLGDPRILTPDADGYWAALVLRSGDGFQIGRFAVTNQEYAAWVEAGGYEDDALWSDEGKAWRDACDDPWPVLARRDDAAKYMVPNQPVVGVTLHEARAFAAAYGARLPRWYERVFAVRGLEKRPYPWGAPFGEGNANTKEEVLERPCAVGMYRRDCTPEGVYDLAGNAGEWTEETAGEEFLLHPGSFDQPSLASWAKALTSEPAHARGAGLGFRLAR